MFNFTLKIFIKQINITSKFVFCQLIQTLGYNIFCLINLQFKNDVNRKNTLKLFGKRLKELRTKNKITQEKLAEIIGVEQQQICRIEKGGCFTTIDNLERLAATFKIPIDELFNFKHQKESDALLSELEELLKKASEDQLKLIYRIVNDILK